MTVQARHINLSNSMLNPVYTNWVAMDGGGVATTKFCDSGFPSSSSQIDQDAMLLMVNTMNSHVVNLPMNDIQLSRKRQREDSNTTVGGDLSVQTMNQRFEVDRLIYVHIETMKRELEAQSRMHLNRTVRLIKEAFAKIMKEKDEQIEKMSKLSMVLQERARSLYLENQLWRDLVQSNEATVKELRSNLEQLLLQVNNKVFGDSTIDGDVDAESCCGSNESGDDEWNKAEGAKKLRWMCRRCGGRESCVLVLPCRHLCLCTTCGPTVDVCPVCKSIKNAGVHVSYS